MHWATRTAIKIDRTACIWLIRRHIDADATISFVPDEEIAELTRAGVRTFDAKAARYRHDTDPITGSKYGELCTFQTLLRDFDLAGSDPALDELASIVHSGDIGHRLDDFNQREGYGIWALMQGLHVCMPDDSAKAEYSMTIWDALYAYCAQVSNRGNGCDRARG